MADINPIPLVACDCCGVQEKKRKVGSGWAKPLSWGHVRVAPTHNDAYPNNIDLMDLCPDCNRTIWLAVSAAIDSARKAAKEKRA